MDDDRIAEEPTRETVTPTRRTPIGGFCCCGKPYDPDGGGESDHYCPVGKRHLCQECVTKDHYNCTKHKVPTRMGVRPSGPAASNPPIGGQARRAKAATR